MSKGICSKCGYAKEASRPNSHLCRSCDKGGKVSEEKRIYVVVAETVQPDEFTSVDQVPGRLAAQCAHVVSLVRVSMALNQENFREFGVYQPFTTIVLSVKDSKELIHIRAMMDRLKYMHTVFFDSNEDVYGWDRDQPHRVLTALATFPITQSEISDVLGHLPLWSPKLVA
jgi:peptidyl-tRNA hydrolase